MEAFVSHSSMDPPITAKRPRSARDWEDHQETITRLYSQEGNKLAEVMEAMEKEYGFCATQRQYKRKLSEWGLGKNIRDREMEAILRKELKRKAEGKQSDFRVRGNAVDPKKISRYKKRKNVSESVLLSQPSPTAATPSDISCDTPAAGVPTTPDVGPNVQFSVRSPGFFWDSPAHHDILGWPGTTLTSLSPAPFVALPAYSETSARASMAIGDSVAAHTSTLPARHYDLGISSTNEALASLSTSPQAWGQYSLQEPSSPPNLLSVAEPAALLSNLSHGVAEPPSRVRMDDTPNLAGAFNINRTNNVDTSWLTTSVAMFAGGEKDLGEQHPETLKSMLGPASSYQRHGRLKDAEKLELQVMKARKIVLGQEHPDTLRSMGNLATTFRDQGRWKEAEELYLQVIEASKRVLGQEHPDTLVSIDGLAKNLWYQKRWKEAEELALQVIEARKSALGEEHPTTLTNMHNLAIIFGDQGRWKEAEKLFLQVTEARKRVLGEEHPDTLMSMGNLATTFRDQGRWKEAEELQLQVIEAKKRVLGEEHPDTLMSMGNLALTFSDQGRWEEAEELYLQVIEASKRVLGQEHPDTLRSMNNLAITFGSQGRWEEAENLHVQVLEMRKKVLGQEHPDTLTSMANLAAVWKSQG